MITGVGPGRRGALVLGAAALLSACAPAPARPSGKDDGHAEVRTDPEPLERRFTELGPLSDPHWLGLVLGVAGSRAPGPTDVRVVGFARPAAGKAKSLVRAQDLGPFRPERPDQVPEELLPYVPKGARWVRSESFDRRMTQGTYTGAFYVDEGSGRVYFDTTDPSVADDPKT
ncbi:hypothetical protein ACFW9D_16940 [Streptomyces sp. NPDC059524]|uniref:hypothetical protein n=1 Tax=Streptomyces sp. NPDC059524 TaxID=3346856 RepID=UPI0036B04FEC